MREMEEQEGRTQSVGQGSTTKTQPAQSDPQRVSHGSTPGPKKPEAVSSAPCQASGRRTFTQVPGSRAPSTPRSPLSRTRRSRQVLSFFEAAHSRALPWGRKELAARIDFWASAAPLGSSPGTWRRGVLLHSAKDRPCVVALGGCAGRSQGSQALTVNSPRCPAANQGARTGSK